MKRYFLSVDGCKSIYRIETDNTIYIADLFYEKLNGNIWAKHEHTSMDHVIDYEQEGLLIAIEEPEALATIERWRNENAA